MRRFLAIPIVAAVFLGAGCLDDPPQPNHPIIFNLHKDKPIQADVGSIQNGVSSTMPSPPPLKKGELASASGNVVISSVTPGQVLTNPFVILGRASTLDGAVQWRIRDDQQNIVASGAVTTDAASPAAFGSFRVRAFYDGLPKTTNGTVQVYLRSPRDGSEQDLVKAAVVLNREIQPLKIFFVDQMKDPQLLHCEIVSPVTRRVTKTDSAPEAAMLELLKGPSASEQTAGNRTALVPETGLRSVTIDGDTATVDFTRQFVLGISGKCQVAALRAQVEQTLKQFQGVRNVKILVEGADVEQYLKP
jgi:hypothetical protein